MVENPTVGLGKTVIKTAATRFDILFNVLLVIPLLLLLILLLYICHSSINHSVQYRAKTLTISTHERRTPQEHISFELITAVKLVPSLEIVKEIVRREFHDPTDGHVAVRTSNHAALQVATPYMPLFEC